MRRWVTVGEQQWQEHQDQAQPWSPDPLPEPGGFRSPWESTGIGEERIDRVLVCGAQEPIAESDGQEDPADEVLGTARSYQSPDDGVRPYQGGEGDTPCDEDLTQGALVEEAEDQAGHGQCHAQRTQRPGQP